VGHLHEAAVHFGSDHNCGLKIRRNLSPNAIGCVMKPGEPGHKDDDPEKTKEEYDNDNHSDQENPNNDEYDKD